MRSRVRRKGSAELQSSGMEMPGRNVDGAKLEDGQSSMPRKQSNFYYNRLEGGALLAPPAAPTTA